MSSFENLWASIRQTVKPGDEYGGWTRDKGHTSLRFQIFETLPNAVVITSPTLSHPRRITKTDFAKVHAAWNEYCAGSIDRAEMGQISQNTSYIFGILHSLEPNSS